MKFLWFSIITIKAIIMETSANVPDITLLLRVTNDNIAQYRCVAGPNVQDSALTFISPLGGPYKDIITESKYFYSDGQQYNSAYDCDFDTNCPSYYEWVTLSESNIVRAIEEIHNLGPVTNERWEKFSTTFSEKRSYSFVDLKRRTSPIHDIGISVRTQGEINIYLLDHSKSKSYSIKLNKTGSELSECSNTERGWACNDPKKGNALNTSEKYWNPIQIILSQKNITIRTQREELLNCNITTPLDIYYMRLNNINKALWKIHDYNYLSIPWDPDITSWKKVGPSVLANYQGSLCISLYTAMCDTCIIRFRLSRSSPIKEIQGNSIQEMQWQHVQLNIQGNPNGIYQLQVQVRGGSNGFWLIDDVRRCYDGETKVISMTVDANTSDVISCQALKYTGWWASLKEGRITTPSFHVCNKRWFTGRKCKVSCRSALMGFDCGGTIVCEPSSEKDAPKCTCAAGYQGDKCQENCIDGKFGSQCASVCPPCRNFCEKTSGVCSDYNKCYINDNNRGCLIENKKPENINITWNEDKINIAWNHPKDSITVTSFIIMVELLNTDLLNGASFNFKKEYEVADMERYAFDIPNSAPLSSKYLVRVRTGKEEFGEASKEVFSGPIIPEFLGDLSLGLRTTNTQLVHVPGAHPSTITRNSSLFIFVCEMTSMGAEFNFTNISHSAFHKWTECKGISWIATGLQVTDKEVNFNIGEYNYNNPNNKELTSESSYIFSAIFINGYAGQTKYTLSSVSSTDASSGGSSVIIVVVLILILLLLLLAAGFIWWKIKRPTTKSDMKVAYHAVSSNPEPTVAISIIPESNIAQTNGNNILLTATQNQNNNNQQQNIPVRETVNNENEYENVSPFSKLVDVPQFSNYVKECIENGELKKQFNLLPEGQTKSSEIGLQKNNISKNRYKNLTAYDHSRVVLEKLPGDPYSDFINANYIDGYKQKNAYIATQGPKPNTVNDFWRMIWQENVNCIVMMTNLIEEGKQKCHQYWPDIDNSETYGLITVRYLQSDIYADYEYRTFEIVNNNTSRKIQQYHFTSWPDHGVPMYPQSLVPFLNKLLLISPASAPIVVHCSAGVGRTGTIILSDICLRMVAGENKIDVLKYFHSMREQRSNMVAKYDQYELVHMVLLECLLTSNTTYPCNKLLKYVDDLKKSKQMKKQIQYLNDTAWYYQINQEIINEPEGSSACNRFPEIVPNRRRIHLSKTAYDSSDYINAVPVDGFRNKGQFIVTQNPLPHTIKDFWKMVLDFNVKDIVSLNELMLHDVTNIKFWPNEPMNEPMTPLPYLKIICVSKSVDNISEKYKLKLVDSRNKNDDEPYHVNVLQLKNWTYEQLTPRNEIDIISLIEEVPKIPRIGSPIVVTCYDGARASGLYVALSFIIEKIKLEQVCDVCLAVRTVRNNRDQFITDIKQFEFLYEAARAYVSTFETYSNFN